MRAPLFELGAFGVDASLLVALGIGLVFGWFLERGGMGNARKLASQFYFTDMAVFKILFTAVVTAMLGLFWLTRLGVLEPALVYVPPTFVLPHLVGGLVFGVGFVIGGLCPGTSCVAISSGRWDGLALLGGMLFGIFLFGEAFPWVEGFYSSTPAGTLTLPEVFDLPYPVVVLGITAGAVAMFYGAEAIERRGPGLVGPGPDLPRRDEPGFVVPAESAAVPAPPAVPAGRGDMGGVGDVGDVGVGS